MRLAADMPAPLDLLVLVTTFGSLRWGEVTALRRMEVDVAVGTLAVRGPLVKRSGFVGERVTGIEPPLSAWENVEGTHARLARA